MVNDNRRARPSAELSALYGLPDTANRCFCGSDGPFVDGNNLNGKRGPFFVWCPACGRTGPERFSYNDALAGWNRATALCDLQDIRMAEEHRVAD